MAFMMIGGATSANAAQANRTLNSGFDTDLSGWNIADVTSPSGVHTTYIDAEGNSNGAVIIKRDPGSNENGSGVSQNPALVAGATYTASFDIIELNGNASVTLQAVDVNGNPNRPAIQTFTTLGHKVVTFTMGDPGGYFQQVFLINDNGADTAVIDNFQVFGEVPVIASNAAPTVSSMPTQEDSHNQAITDVNLAQYFTDAEGDDLNFEAINLPIGLSIDPFTGVVTGTPTVSNGSKTVTIKAVDTVGGGEVSTTFNWNIVTQNTVLTEIGEDDDAKASDVTIAELNSIAPALTGVKAENEAAYQAYIAEVANTFSAPATPAEVQAMITAVNATVTAQNTSNTVLAEIGEDDDAKASDVTIAELNSIVPALTGVVTANEAAYQAYIADVANTFSAPATPAEVQAMVDSVNLTNSAHALIEAYANDNTQPAPGVQDYVDAGVTGVTAENLADVNAAIDAVTGADVDTIAKIQALVDGEVATDRWFREESNESSTTFTYGDEDTDLDVRSTVAVNAPLALTKKEELDIIRLTVSAETSQPAPAVIPDTSAGCDTQSYAAFVTLFKENGEIETGYYYADSACGGIADATVYDGERLQFVPGTSTRLEESTDKGGMVIIIDAQLKKATTFGER